MSKSAVAIMGKKNAVLLPISDIKTTFYVRRELNEENVIQFMELYQANAELPPVKVVRGTMELQEGRHRMAALERIGRKNVECELVEAKPRPDLIVEAFGFNVGGALPPTRSDITFTMKQLIEGGTSTAFITKSFEKFYPPSMVRRYMRDAQSEVSKAKLTRAVTAVARSGSTVPVAAAEFDVDEEELRDELSGKRSKRKKEGSYGEVKSVITRSYRGNGVRVGHMIGKVLEKFEDGVYTAAQAESVFSHIDKLHEQSGKSIAQRRARFNALKARLRRK